MRIRDLTLALVAAGCADPPRDAPTDAGAGSACGGERTNVPAAVRTLWVATDGSDATGDGSQEKPFGWIGGAKLRAGDALLLREGTYRPKATIFLDGLAGNSTAWIRIAAAPGAKVVLDGAGATVAPGAALFTLSGASYVALEGLEVTNSSGALVHAEDCDHVTVRDLRLHHAAREGLLLIGTDLLAEDDEIWDVANVNVGGTMGSGWPGGIDSSHRKGLGLTTNLVVRRNRVHDVWGECIIAAFVDGARIEDNTVSDCYSTGIYGDHTRNVRIERNLVWVTNKTREIDGSAMTGVDFMVEKYGSDRPAPFPTENVVVANNVVARVGTGFGWYGDYDHAGNSYGAMLFANNVVWQGKDAAFRFRKPGASAGTAGPVRIVDNVIVADMAFDVRGAPVTALANCYEVADLGDLVDPRALSGACGLSAPALPAVFDGFRLKARAPGAALAEVTMDAFCRPRSPTAPGIGLSED